CATWDDSLSSYIF
nr:immunoglobulin light chain junction region [Macaca mulatta]